MKIHNASQPHSYWWKNRIRSVIRPITRAQWRLGRNQNVIAVPMLLRYFSYFMVMIAINLRNWVLHCIWRRLKLSIKLEKTCVCSCASSVVLCWPVSSPAHRNEISRICLSGERFLLCTKAVRSSVQQGNAPVSLKSWILSDRESLRFGQTLRQTIM